MIRAALAAAFAGFGRDLADAIRDDNGESDNGLVRRTQYGYNGGVPPDELRVLVGARVRVSGFTPRTGLFQGVALPGFLGTIIGWKWQQPSGKRARWIAVLTTYEVGGKRGTRSEGHRRYATANRIARAKRRG